MERALEVHIQQRLEPIGFSHTSKEPAGPRIALHEAIDGVRAPASIGCAINEFHLSVRRDDDAL